MYLAKATIGKLKACASTMSRNPTKNFLLRNAVAVHQLTGANKIGGGARIEHHYSLRCLKQKLAIRI